MMGFIGWFVALWMCRWVSGRGPGDPRIQRNHWRRAILINIRIQTHGPTDSWTHGRTLGGEEVEGGLVGGLDDVPLLVLLHLIVLFVAIAVDGGVVD